MDEQAQVQTQQEATPETTVAPATPEAPLAGTCTREDHKCLCEFGLIEVVDANGVHYQMTKEQAMNELAKSESIKQALGVK